MLLPQPSGSCYHNKPRRPEIWIQLLSLGINLNNITEDASQEVSSILLGIVLVNVSKNRSVVITS